MKTGGKRGISTNSRRDRMLSPSEAETISLQALGFLSRDPERIERFFALTGIAPADVRGLAREAGFQLAILDHLASDEPLLLVFVREERLAPEDVNAARYALGGGDMCD
jgi:hypothetical protein